MYLMVLIALTNMVLKMKHVVIMLMSLEVIYVVLVIVVGVSNILGHKYLYLFMFLMVSDGCLGLSLLVNYIRFHGCDYMMNLKLNF
uniref:NADH dehydrogenase subunit 4L n=1 Tax=Paratemnoides elongatus TaxID=51805 RepID=H9MFH8_9ARAC|nr:NADH dehydrogenase subunit 4L [Paratemnoides elongatus]AEX37723.1 NADH dehydrogenase subunit 4L [Paratemnoides elongatus]